MARLDAATSCTRCELSLTRQRVVIGSGEVGAALVIVGEAPGRSEDEGGQPFIGRSGQLLFRLLGEEIGLTREECYVTNVVKCRPPKNRPPRVRELRACGIWWDLQLAQMSPRVIMTLGNTASRAVLGTDAKIGDIHGRVHEVDGRVVIPTYHPAAGLRAGPNVVDVMREDLRKIRQHLGTS
jgi:DNA polymerase